MCWRWAGLLGMGKGECCVGACRVLPRTLTVPSPRRERNIHAHDTRFTSTETSHAFPLAPNLGPCPTPLGNTPSPPCRPRHDPSQSSTPYPGQKHPCRLRHDLRKTHPPPSLNLCHTPFLLRLQLCITRPRFIFTLSHLD